MSTSLGPSPAPSYILRAARSVQSGIVFPHQFRVCQSGKRDRSTNHHDHPRITLPPDVFAGKTRHRRHATFRRIRVRPDGRRMERSRYFGELSSITPDDILACLAYARDALSSEKVFPSAARYCVFSPTRIFLLQRSPPWRQPGMMSCGSEPLRRASPTRGSGMGGARASNLADL